MTIPIDADSRDSRSVTPSEPGDRARFERLFLPHLDSAYSLARWLVRDYEAAEDVVQDACLRALRFFGGFHGEDARPWFLAIVRHAAYDRLKADNRRGATEPFDEDLHTEGRGGPAPDAALLRAADDRDVRRALEELPVELREALILREIEGLSYKEIATVIDVPIGTVMSRLARGRERLRRLLSARPGGEI